MERGVYVMAEWIVEITDGVPHLQRMTELVRCKDCKWFETPCWCLNIESMIEKDGFCYLGERRTDGD